MANENITHRLFNSIDNQDTALFLTFLSDAVEFRFGNAEPVSGKAAVGEAVNGFFSSVKSLQHTLTESWKNDNAIICHGHVTYTRHDSTTLSIPFANILTMDNNLIKDYRIFADISALYGTA